MEERDCVGDAGNEGVDRETIAPYVEATAGFSEVLGDAVGLVIGEGDLTDGNAQAHVAQVVERREAMVGNLINVEGELGPDVLVPSFSVVDAATVLAGEGRKFNGDGEVDGIGMSDVVADVVRERADEMCIRDRPFAVQILGDLRSHFGDAFGNLLTGEKDLKSLRCGDGGHEDSIARLGGARARAAVQIREGNDERQRVRG